MRAADLIALITAAAWLGGNLALVTTAIVMFSLAKQGGVDASTYEVGELFGPVFSTWSMIGGILLAIIVLARIASWIARLHRREFTHGSLLGVAMLIVVVTTYILGASAIADTVTARSAWEIATEKTPDQVDALQGVFNAAHKRSESLMGGLTAGLVCLIAVLGGSLWRRGRILIASSPVRTV